MTPDLAGAVVALVGGFGLAGAVIRRAALRSGLGLAHPAVAWLALHAVFFGAGGLVLALTTSAAGQAAYTGLAATAFALGLAASAALAARGARSEAGGREAAVADRTSAQLAPVRDIVAVIAALAAVLLVVPTLLRTGIPFLTPDITGSRTELAGLIVQPLRVALPALAVAAVLAARGPAGGTREAPGRPVVPVAVPWAVAVVAALMTFELLLASRYLVAELGAAIVLGWLLAGGRLPWRVVALLVVVGLVGFTGIQVLRAWDEAAGRELAFVVERTINRVLLVQPRTLEALMEAIPAEEPFFGGLTWLRRLGPLLGRDDIPNLGYWIYPQVVGGSQVVAGYAAPGLIGEAWANFGWAGLTLFAVLGAASERLGVLLTLRRTATADVVAGALLVLFVARTHALGLNGLLVLVALVVTWRLVAARPAGLGGDVRRVLSWRVVSGTRAS